MALRTTYSGLFASTSLASGTRISGSMVYAAVSNESQQRVSQSQLFSLVANTSNQRVTYHQTYGLASIHEAVLFNFLEGGEIYGYEEFAFEVNPYLIPELNPYRPTVPDEFFDMGEEFYYFNRENQEILRQQHNITQAGDTTYPFQVFLGLHDDKAFTLGSTSRFYHEDFGLIQARYVEFGEFVQPTFASYPVGLLKASQQLDWIVTNQIQFSDPDLVVGMYTSYDLPIEGQYGWVITNGVNVLEAGNAADTSELGEGFAWSDTGLVSPNAIGRVIGRRLNSNTASRLQPGYFKIELESYSKAQIEGFIANSISALGDQLASIQAAIANLDSLTDLPATILAIQRSITNLNTLLAAETRIRISYDDSLRAQILANAGVTQSDLDAAIAGIDDSAIHDVFASQILVLQNSLTALTNLVNAIPAVDLTSINAAIVQILESISLLQAQPFGILPAVNGDVPPVLLYLDDGNLVYVEVYES